MLIKLLEKYSDIVQSSTVLDFDRDGPNLRLKGRVTFADGTVLFIKQIVLGAFIFKYAYHWQNSEGNIICRWDNAPHWPGTSTHPHHKHVAVGKETVVKESRGGDLDEVFQEIASIIRGNKGLIDGVNENK